MGLGAWGPLFDHSSLMFKRKKERKSWARWSVLVLQCRRGPGAHWATHLVPGQWETVSNSKVVGAEEWQTAKLGLWFPHVPEHIPEHAQNIHVNVKSSKWVKCWDLVRQASENSWGLSRGYLIHRYCINYYLTQVGVKMLFPKAKTTLRFSSYFLTADLHIIYKFVVFCLFLRQGSDYVLSRPSCPWTFSQCWD